jgi:hypothetical protein
MRGDDMASPAFMPKSTMLIKICGTVWLIAWPPGVPRAIHERPSRITMVGQVPESFLRVACFARRHC